MSLPYKMPNYNSTDSYFDKKRTIYSKIIKSEDGSFKLTGSGVIRLLSNNWDSTISATDLRGGKISIFNSYVDGFYEVHADDTVDITVQVSISSSTDQTGYVLSYLYEDKIAKIEARELLINPQLGRKDYSLLEPTIVGLDRHIIKSFRLENLKIGNNTKLCIYVTLPLLSEHGNDYVATIHEIPIKKR